MMLLPVSAHGTLAAPDTDRPDAAEESFAALLVSRVADQQPGPAIPSERAEDIDGAPSSPTEVPATDEPDAPGTVAPGTVAPGIGAAGADATRVPGRTLGLSAVGWQPLVEPGVANRPDGATPTVAADGGGSPDGAFLLDDARTEPAGELGAGGRSASVEANRSGAAGMSQGQEFPSPRPEAATGGLGAAVAAAASAARAPGEAATAVHGVLRTELRDQVTPADAIRGSRAADQVLDAGVAAAVDGLGDSLARLNAAPSPVGRGIDAGVLDRVLRAVEALENAPPPRRLAIEVEGIRLTIGLQGDEVRVVVRAGADQLGADGHRDLGDLLRGRGLDLAADSGSDRGASQRGGQAPDRSAVPPEGEPRHQRPTVTSDDLRL
jgi:hypothetical protein